MQTETDAAPTSGRPPAGVTSREDFAELSRRVRAGGLFRRRSRYYAWKIPVTIGALVVLVAVAVLIGDSWWNLTVAVALALVMGQISFLGHDAGHRQISGNRRGNDLVGLLLANLLSGVSFGWWLTKHSRHHGHTNQDGKDPDMDAGALVYTSEQTDQRGWFGRGYARTQPFNLIPLLFLESLNLHMASVTAVARRRDRAAAAEAGLLLGHAVVFVLAPFLILSPLRAVVFVAVSQAVFGFYLGVSFLTNHVGMPTVTGSDDLGFLRRQVLTSRNLSGPLFTGFLFGGLDSQIEHHLFPSMPRANLRRARTVVRDYCVELRIPYEERSPWAAYGDVIRHLRSVGKGTLADAEASSAA
jgi:fatty acid desaturase